MDNGWFTAEEFRHEFENKVSKMNRDEVNEEFRHEFEDKVSRMNPDEVNEIMSVTDLASRIPNKWIQTKFLEFKGRIKPRVPQWDGYYPQPNPRQYPHPPCFTVGSLDKALTSIKLFKEYNCDWKVVASAGGLILCRGESIDEFQRDERLEVAHTAQKAAGRRQKTRRQKSNPPGTCRCCWTWVPLVICNPVSKQVRLLPEAMQCAAREGEAWDYVGVQAALIEGSDLSYEVILALRHFVFVYSSKTHKWRRYPCQIPFTFGSSRRGPWDRSAPWTCIGGHLYCADILRRGPGKHVVSLFQVDYKALMWKRRGQFTVRKRYWNVSRLDSAFDCICKDMMDTELSFEMLECMGQLYVVIAARADEHLTTEFTSAFTIEEYQQWPDIPGLDTYPIQFHILNLKDAFDGDDREESEDGRDSFRHQILRMVLPQSPKPPCIVPDDEEGYDRKQEVLSVYGNALTEMGRWFSCVARGSKIFIYFHDYLMQFDVLTGESKTGIICEVEKFGIQDTVYFPNAAMAP